MKDLLSIKTIETVTSEVLRSLEYKDDKDMEWI